MKFKTKSKIIEVPTEVAQQLFDCDRVLIGFCGNAEGWPTVVDYLHDPDSYKAVPKIKNLEMMMLNKRGIYHATTLKNWTLINEPHLSIGSGSHYAMGAMSNGCTPKQAVKTAMKHDPNTGMGIKEYTL